MSDPHAIIETNPQKEKRKPNGTTESNLSKDSNT